MSHPDVGMTHRGVSRRALLGATAASTASLALGWGVGAATAGEPPAERHTEPELMGTRTVPFYGEHQAGVVTPPQAYGTWTALTLAPGTDVAALRRLLRIWTTDAARLTAGLPGLSDSEPELAAAPASLTVTVGLSPGALKRLGRPQPAWCEPLPDFGTIDAELEPARCGGDVMLQVCADDPVTVAHAVRVLVRGARPFGQVAWQQRGFRRAVGAETAGKSMRNLMGQLDGTRNPPDIDLPDLVWVPDGVWRGGTAMVFRRIRMELDTWEQVDRRERERVMGRFLASGAPLTGRAERDEPDLEARDAAGSPVIDAHAHIRRSRDDDPMHRFLRRPYSYDDTAGALAPDTGLVFVTFQRDVGQQFVPIQQRLAEADLLNVWTVPTSSAVFAILPGVEQGAQLGDSVLG